ncbi:X-ray radiation resistance-associated protein 1 [Pelodytes ibericus]
MASAGLYQMGSRGAAVSNCFPARQRFPLTNGGAGHWSVTHKTAPEGRFRALICSASSDGTISLDTRKTSVTRPSRSGPSRRTPHNQECVLDGLFLMNTHYVDRATDLCSVDVSDRNLTSARRGDFLQFNSVAYMNASENLLALEDFLTFPSLRELDLSMNGMRRIQIKRGDLPHLEVLDLSYNNLSPKDLPHLGVLPRLRALHVSGNGLTHLPTDMSVCHGRDSEIPGFPSLEILLLDDNKLSCHTVFPRLANLKSLRMLNLDNNGISGIPYLHELDPTKPADILHSRGPGSPGYRAHNTEGSETDKPGEDLNYTVLPNADDPDRTDVIFTSCDRPSNDSSLKCPLLTRSSSLRPGGDMVALSSPDRLAQTFSPPLPNLRFLSLADNKVAYEENLLAAALFPSLEELVIHGNPLTTFRKGDSLLKSFLQDRLGINVISRKSPQPHKPHITIPIKKKRKVNTHIPKIPKQPVMLEPPPGSLLGFLYNSREGIPVYTMSPSPLPPIKSSISSSQEEKDQSQETFASNELLAEGEMDPDPGVESVFMTQVEGFQDEMSSPVSDSPSDEETQRDIPERYKGYEELLDAQTDPRFIEPVGIQSNVRALEHALKHLLVHRDCKPRPCRTREPDIPRNAQETIVTAPLMRQLERYSDRHKLDKETSPGKRKAQVVEEIITRMRDSTHITEEPLDSILQATKSIQAQRKATRLLNDLQERYKTFYAETVHSAQELESSLLETASKLRKAQRQLGTMEDKVKSATR